MRLFHGVTGQDKVVFRSFDLVWDKSKQSHQLSMDVCDSCHRIGLGKYQSPNNIQLYPGSCRESLEVLYFNRVTMFHASKNCW